MRKNSIDWLRSSSGYRPFRAFLFFSYRVGLPKGTWKRGRRSENKWCVIWIRARSRWIILQEKKIGKVDLTNDQQQKKEIWIFIQEPASIGRNPFRMINFDIVTWICRLFATAVSQLIITSQFGMAPAFGGRFPPSWWKISISTNRVSRLGNWMMKSDVSQWKRER